MDEEVVREFLVEGGELLDQLEQDLIALEGSPGERALLNSAFRSLHTLKGNAGTFGYPRLQELCHAGESLMDKVRNRVLALDSDKTSLLLECIDGARALLDTIEETGREGDVEHEQLISKLLAFDSRPR